MDETVPERACSGLGEALRFARAAVAENDTLDVGRSGIGAVMYSRALLRRALVDLLAAFDETAGLLDDGGEARS